MSNIKNKTPLDENGRRHDEWIVYYANSDQLWFKLNYINGVPHGLVEEFDVDGNLIYRGYTNMGRETGFWYYPQDKNKYFLCVC